MKRVRQQRQLGARPRWRPHDVAMYTVAAGQKGVATREQLLQAGVSAGAIAGALRCGRLRILHRGVYQVGAVLATWGRELAAVLACGPDSVLSHRSAAVLWGMLSALSGDAVDVTMCGGLRGRQPGIRGHRVRQPLSRRELRLREGVPVTSPARTLLDLAAVASAEDLRRAFDNAEQARIVTHRAVREMLRRHPGRRGAARLAALLPPEGHQQLTFSQMERSFLRLLRRYGLPLPQTNVRVLGFSVDCYWPDVRLIVELDGFHVHGTRRAFEADRRRGLALTAAGYRVVRITWTQIEREPKRTMALVAQALVPRPL